MNEKHVQQVVVNWLTSYYRSRVSVQAVVSRTEVTVSRDTNLGWGCADGLVVSRLSNGEVHTASLEAKSAKTLYDIIPPRNPDQRWILHALAAGGVGLLLAGLIGWFIGTWLTMWIFPLVAFLGIGVAYLLLTREHSRYLPIKVVQQVKRYPADEPWIAVSDDVYERLHSDEKHALRSDCQKEGIGLLEVNSAGDVTALVEPRTHRAPRRQTDYLTCYARAKEIRRELFAEGKENGDSQTDLEGG